MACPDLQTLELFVLHRMAEDERDSVRQHLGNCPVCQEWVTQAMANEQFLARLRLAQAGDESASRASPERPVLTQEEAQTLVGQRYRIVRKIGDGRISTVFQAVDSVLERQVAVKFLRQDRGLHEWHEARLMGQLNHPHIAQVYEIGQADPYRYMVM